MSTTAQERKRSVTHRVLATFGELLHAGLVALTVFFIVTTMNGVNKLPEEFIAIPLLALVSFHLFKKSLRSGKK